MLDPTTLIDSLSRVLMDAYDALPIQDQEGPLGDQISAILHEAQHPHTPLPPSLAQRQALAAAIEALLALWRTHRIVDEAVNDGCEALAAAWQPMQGWREDR